MSNQALVAYATKHGQAARVARHIADTLELLGWNVTLHDLRRTVVTGMNELGIQPHVAEAVVNHVSGRAKAGVAGLTRVVATTLQSVSGPAHGTAAITGAVVRYAPAADFCGTDTFTYRAARGASG